MEDESYLFDASQEREYLMHVMQVVGHRSDGLSEIISASGEVIGNDPLEVVISKIGNAVMQQQILDERLKDSLAVNRPQFSPGTYPGSRRGDFSTPNNSIRCVETTGRTWI